MLPPPLLATMPSGYDEEEEEADVLIMSSDEEINLSSENEMEYDLPPLVTEKPATAPRTFSLPSLEAPPPLVRELYPSFNRESSESFPMSLPTSEEE